MIRKSAAVLISDIHYNINTLELADEALRMAINKANELNVPLIVAGDLHDTKANLRGECVNAMISAFMSTDKTPVVLVGNHDKINEKSEDHSLNFLSKYAFVLSQPYKSERLNNTYFIPYHTNAEELKSYLKTIPKGSTLIMHQGITGSNSGEYIQDKSAITKENVAGFRVISGHYHQRQIIELPDNGVWDYIGNPFTVNYGEANDPPKGFQILRDDGSLEFVPTNLRKHVVYEIDLNSAAHPAIVKHSVGDLIWLKVKGTKEQLSKFKKPFDCKLDLIPLDMTTKVENKSLNQHELLDSMIDSLTNVTDNTKINLKELWKELA